MKKTRMVIIRPQLISFEIKSQKCSKFDWNTPNIKEKWKVHIRIMMSSIFFLALFWDERPVMCYEQDYIKKWMKYYYYHYILPKSMLCSLFHFSKYFKSSVSVVCMSVYTVYSFYYIGKRLKWNNECKCKMYRVIII